MTRIFLSLSFFLALLCACGHGDKSARTNDPVLASVYDRNLYATDLQDIVPPGTARQDSILLVNAYVQRWVRDQLLMYEAERNIPKDLDIDQLVRDYRASLVRFNFEEKIIAEKLDSTVSESELKAYYENNKDQFQLENTILKCLLLKIPANVPTTEVNQLWNNRNAADEAKLAALVKQWSGIALLDHRKWYKIDEIAALLPKGTLTADNVQSRREGTLSDGGYRYYYRVLDAVRGKETAPLDYVREQASKVILHQRKQQVLERWKEDLYQKELKHQNIKIGQ